MLAVLAPVITSPDNELAYPGDPMCLYGALSLTVRRAEQARAMGPASGSPFPRLCPDWGVPNVPVGPSARRTADASIFDPRVWTPESAASFRSTLRRLRPRVVLISTVSAGHRYALEMAGMAKRESPGCLVVVGGRHVDETITYDPAEHRAAFAFSSTVAGIADGRVEPVVDFLVAGDGPFALDLLMRAISLAASVETRTARVSDVVAALDALARAGERPPGSSVIVAIDGGTAHVFPIRGRGYDLGELPSPYEWFSIRARFPIFPGSSPSRPKLTAHAMTAISCPYRCSFCSESIAVTGVSRRFAADRVETALARVCEYVHYGAQAVFFDDSVFWMGNMAAALQFCALLTDARATRGASLPSGCRKWLPRVEDVDRLEALEWGAQFTVDLLTTVWRPQASQRLLAAARSAGCSYLYLGLESMSDAVMAGIHKNLRRSTTLPWAERVRTALEQIRDAGLRAGTSVLFGLDGETRESIQETVEGVGRLIDDGLLALASPNILTYHPGAEITARHGMADALDYHSSGVENRPPFVFFEEAYPGVVSRHLTEADVWYVHRLTAARWGTHRNGADLACDPVAAAQGGE